MAKPRLHEIAKELGIKSSDVVAAAIEMGMEVKSHQSSVSDEEADKLRARFGAKNTAKAETEPKPAPAESKEEKKTAEVNNTPSEKKPEVKPAQGSGAKA